MFLLLEWTCWVSSHPLWWFHLLYFSNNPTLIRLLCVYNCIACGYNLLHRMFKCGSYILSVEVLSIMWFILKKRIVSETWRNVGYGLFCVIKVKCINKIYQGAISILITRYIFLWHFWDWSIFIRKNNLYIVFRLLTRSEVQTQVFESRKKLA